MNVIELECSSMSHVCDRAKAFLFCSPPYKVAAVKPNGFVLKRANSDTLFVKLAGSPSLQPEEA